MNTKITFKKLILAAVLALAVVPSKAEGEAVYKPNPLLDEGYTGL